MAKRSQYDIDSEKLRGMGLNPEKMTLRERHEALNGPVEGESFVELVKRVNKNRKTNKKSLYRKVVDIYPIEYGIKAPTGPDGEPDYKQQRFNRMVHLNQWPHCANDDDFEDGRVIVDSIPVPWIVSGMFPPTMTDNEMTASYIKNMKFVRAFGCADRHEFSARMQLRNELVFEEWLADYAERINMDINLARHDVLESRKNAAHAASSVGPHPTKSLYKGWVKPNLDGLDIEALINDTADESNQHCDDNASAETSSCSKRDDFGEIVRVENIPVIKVPKFERKGTESHPKMSPEDILRALGAGEEAFRILKGKSALQDGKMAYEQPRLLDVTPTKAEKAMKGCPKGHARPVSRPRQLSLAQGYLHEVFETS